MEFDHRHYVPILKAKRGELVGLSQLDPGIRQSLTPVFEIQAVDRNWDKGIPRKTEAAHLAAVVESIEKYWGPSDAFFVDIDSADLAEKAGGDSRGRGPYEYIFDLLKAKGLNGVPAVPLGLSTSALRAVGQIVARDRRGLMLRVSASVLASESSRASLSAFPSTFGIPAGQVDLLVDLGVVDAASHALVLAGLQSVWANIPSLAQWRTVTLASAAFPQSISNLSRGPIEQIERLDWKLWRALAMSLAPNERHPTFGDFGVAPHKQPALDPRTSNPAYNIRYTVSEKWLVLRGRLQKPPRNKKPPTGPTNPQMCIALTNHPEFQGTGCCSGDKYIIDCASGTAKTGSLEVWRRIGTVHHLTFVVRQIASSYASAGIALPRAAP